MTGVTGSSGVDDPDVDLVLKVLREVGPHGVRDDPRTAGLDVFTYFVGRDLRRRDLSGIRHGLSLDFSRADLRQADLRGTHLHEARLRDADLRGADARGARVRADLTGARLQGLRLDGAELTRCRIANSAPDLARCSVSSCTLVDVDLSWTRFTGGVLGGDLADCDLTGLSVDPATQLHGTWTRCELGGVLLAGAEADAWLLVDSHGEGVDLAGARLDSAELLDCRLPGLRADTTVLSRAVIVRTDLSDASLRGADLSGADLEEVSLVGADLRGAVLTGATFDRVDLTDALLDDRALDALA